MTTRRRHAATGVGVACALLLVVTLVVLLVRGPDADPPTPTRVAPTLSASPAPPATPARVDPCAGRARSREGGFVPTEIGVQGVVRRASVLALPRDADGVVGVAPVSEKEAFAWDLGGVEPGSRRGHVLLNTHTWPDGTAMGNRLLEALEVGDRLVLRGAGRLACYRVTDRVEVPEDEPPADWDAREGPPQVVIVVCSGERRGPGQWSHRTLWFASPVL